MQITFFQTESYGKDLIDLANQLGHPFQSLADTKCCQAFYHKLLIEKILSYERKNKKTIKSDWLFKSLYRLNLILHSVGMKFTTIFVIEKIFIKNCLLWSKKRSIRSIAKYFRNQFELKDHSFYYSKFNELKVKIFFNLPIVITPTWQS